MQIKNQTVSLFLILGAWAPDFLFASFCGEATHFSLRSPRFAVSAPVYETLRAMIQREEITQVVREVRQARLARRARTPQPIQLEETSNFVQANEVLVTKNGSRSPAEAKKMLSDLQVQVEQLKGHGLSLGEGASGLVPFLRKQNVAIRGLDLWYSADLATFAAQVDLSARNDSDAFPYRKFVTPEDMISYVERNRAALLTGDARDIPSPDNSLEFLLSYNFLHNLPLQDLLAVLDDGVRVLKPGGIFKAYGYLPLAQGWKDAYELIIRRFLEDGLESGIRFQAGSQLLEITKIH